MSRCLRIMSIASPRPFLVSVIPPYRSASASPASRSLRTIAVTLPLVTPSVAASRATVASPVGASLCSRWIALT